MLIDGDLKVWESLAILEYLAERFPERNVWPADVARRAEARSVASEMATGFFALRGQCPFNLHRRPSPLPADAALAADVARIDAIWRSLLEKSGGPFLFGAFSAADAMFAPVVGRFRSYELTPSQSAARYMEAIRIFLPGRNGRQRRWRRPGSSPQARFEGDRQKLAWGLAKVHSFMYKRANFRHRQCPSGHSNRPVTELCLTHWSTLNGCSEKKNFPVQARHAPFGRCAEGCDLR